MHPFIPNIELHSLTTHLFPASREHLSYRNNYINYPGQIKYICVRDNLIMTHKCINPDCNKEFESKRTDAKYCSDKCRKQVKRLVLIPDKVIEKPMKQLATIVNNNKFVHPSSFHQQLWESKLRKQAKA